jgi:hypothetical protein
MKAIYWILLTGAGTVIYLCRNPLIDMAKTLTSEELSRNFRLYEFLRSDTADKLGATEQYNPPAIVLQNLKHLAGELQIVRDLYGKAMPVTSGYRCPVVNKAVGGVNNSAHAKGLAADINTGSKAGNMILFNLVADLVEKKKLSIDQLINEYDYSWIHFGYRQNRSEYRNQILTVA